MADELFANKWLMRLVFSLVFLALIFAQLLPLETTPRRWAAPDFLVLLTMAWAARQPEYTPPLLVAGLFFLADLLLLRPPGLFAAIMVVATELMRNRARHLRDATFMTEWLTVATIMVIAAVSFRMVSFVFLLDTASLGLILVQVMLNIAIYPFVVLLSHLLFGVRRATVHDGSQGAA